MIMESELWGIVVAIFLGALIGLQREYKQQHIHLKRFAGFRTFILITFFGAILGYLGKSFDSLLVIIGFVAVIALSLISYVLTYMREKSTSSTTEVAAIMSYILGVMCTVGYVQLAVIFGILIVAFLAFKERFHNFAKSMEKNELMAVVKFALIALVVLPILPNRNFSPLDLPGLGEILVGMGASVDFLGNLDVFNFYHIWLMVIFVAGISFVGYFLSKFVGEKKGYGLLGFIGGLVSSTAVTLSMASESKKAKGTISPFVMATVIATSVMFIRVIFEVAVVNSALLPGVILPMGIMAVAGIVLAFLFSKFSRRHKKEADIEKVELKQPFALIPALKFGGFFVLVIFVSRLMQLLFGEIGIYATSVLSGLADVDAIVLTMSSLAKNGGVTSAVATTAIVLAAVTNTLVKGGMAYFLGNKKFGRVVLGILLIVLILGSFWLF